MGRHLVPNELLFPVSSGGIPASHPPSTERRDLARRIELSSCMENASRLQTFIPGYWSLCSCHEKNICATFAVFSTRAYQIWNIYVHKKNKKVENIIKLIKVELTVSTLILFMTHQDLNFSFCVLLLFQALKKQVQCCSVSFFPHSFCSRVISLFTFFNQAHLLHTEKWIIVANQSLWKHSLVFNTAHYLAYSLINMRCANKTMVNYEQSGCLLPISPLSAVHQHCLIIIDAHHCAMTHHNDCLIRDMTRVGLSMDCNKCSSPLNAK